MERGFIRNWPVLKVIANRTDIHSMALDVFGQPSMRRKPGLRGGGACAGGVRDGSGGSARLRRGFSLVELAVVLTIMGIMAAVAVPRLSASISKARVKAATQRVIADLEQAKATAIAKSQPMTIAFGATGYTIAGIRSLDRFTRDTAVSLAEDPYGVELSKVDFDGAQSVTFDMYGVPNSGGSLCLSAGGLTTTLSVDAQTGAVSVP